MQENTKSQEEIEDWLIDQIVKVTKKPADEIGISEPLVNYGINSIDAVNISAELEEWLGYELAASIIYQFPSIESMAMHLSGGQSHE